MSKLARIKALQAIDSLYPIKWGDVAYLLEQLKKIAISKNVSIMYAKQAKKLP